MKKIAPRNHLKLDSLFDVSLLLLVLWTSMIYLKAESKIRNSNRFDHFDQKQVWENYHRIYSD
ncbi:hypothetical protein Hanom_Chr12g01145571 [Helianthus anomalus]